MKKLQDIPDHYRIDEVWYYGSPEQVSVFNRKMLNGKFVPETSSIGEFVQLNADNYYNRNFERAFMYFLDRCPTWPEMVELKEFFWSSNEIVFQVHPKKSEYVNIMESALHLWKAKDPQSLRELQKVRTLVINLMAILQHRQVSSELYFTQGCTFGKSFVAIHGGKEWPTWEEVCSIKKHCFGENRTALQFNVCREIDLNPKHILILWDAEEFPNIALPPKEYV